MPHAENAKECTPCRGTREARRLAPCAAIRTRVSPHSGERLRRLKRRDDGVIDVESQLRKPGTAYLIALPVAPDREGRNRGAGLRRFPLVAAAACGYTLVGFSVLDSAEVESRCSCR